MKLEAFQDPLNKAQSADWLDFHIFCEMHLSESQNWLLWNENNWKYYNCCNFLPHTLLLELRDYSDYFTWINSCSNLELFDCLV